MGRKMYITMIVGLQLLDIFIHILHIIMVLWVFLMKIMI